MEARVSGGVFSEMMAKVALPAGSSGAFEIPYSGPCLAIKPDMLSISSAPHDIMRPWVSPSAPTKDAKPDKSAKSAEDQKVTDSLLPRGERQTRERTLPSLA